MLVVRRVRKGLNSPSLRPWRSSHLRWRLEATLWFTNRMGEILVVLGDGVGPNEPRSRDLWVETLRQIPNPIE